MFLLCSLQRWVILYFPYPICGDRHGEQPHALGGGFLIGDRLVKFAYLDEAGVSNPEQEPILIVGGVVVDADKDWVKARNLLELIADDVALPEYREGLIFHAKDIFGGSGAFPREKFSLEARLDIIRRIVQITDTLMLPIIYGATSRELEPAFMEIFGISKGQSTSYLHAISYFSCIAWVEDLMRNVGSEGEIATIIVENKQEVRQIIKSIHAQMRHPISATLHVPAAMRHLFPVTRIIDTTHFANKSEAPILQIADVVVFCLKRCISRMKHWEILKDVLPRSKTIHFPSADHVSVGGIL